jgi:hypothetical protein
LTLAVSCAGETNRPLDFWPQTEVFQLKIYKAEIIELLLVVLCVVRAVRSFVLTLVTNEASNRWRLAEITSRSERAPRFWHDRYLSRRPSSRVLRDSTGTVQVKCILLSKWQQYWGKLRISDYTCSRIKHR